MCLWFFHRLRTQRCSAFCNWNCTCPCLALCLAPLGALIGLLCGVTFGVIKWIPGTVHRVRSSCRAYCSVISAGAEHYDAEAARVQQRAPPMPQGNPAVLMDVVVSRVETRLQSTGHVCAAELYCCCSPCFVLCMLLMPVYLFLNLVVWIGLIRGPCIGCNAGCGLSCAEFSKRLCEAIKTIDILSSLAAFGTPNPWCEYSRVSQEGSPTAPQAPPIAVAQPVQATQIQQPIAYATY